MRADQEDFWALKDVSFEVRPGEVVGIIGRNGAGKSTLLKVLSRITKPSAGRVVLNGRVGSLLEVGTGFHPELTGRENVYLNGSILGMSRREIERKFDEIVAFAEVEKFLDTPVKRYSSGMYVRLAFAVAAHLEPEILIVDEVLAVGDATYQKRCLDRMAYLADSGLTVIFVSHNMEIIPRLCKSAILLSQGRVAMVGSAAAVTGHYITDLTKSAQQSDLAGLPRSGNGRARFHSLQLLDAQGQQVLEHLTGESLTCRMVVDSTCRMEDVGVAVVLQNLYGTRIVTSWNREVNARIDLSPGLQQVDCTFHSLNLRPGHQVQISLWMESGEVLDSVDAVRVVSVAETTETASFSKDAAQGVMLCNHTWGTRAV